MKPLTRQMGFVCLTVTVIVFLFFDQITMAGIALGGLLALIDPHVDN